MHFHKVSEYVYAVRMEMKAACDFVACVGYEMLYNGIRHCTMVRFHKVLSRKVFQTKKVS